MERASEYTENYPVQYEQPFMVRAYLALKRTFYYLCKGIGLFHVARRLMRGRLRIICYHGFSLSDESLFLPRTFIDPDTFTRRMKYLSGANFTVIDLNMALDLLDRGALPPKSVVITIDDGFYSTYSAAFPVLEKLDFPATVYITTYYAVKQGPVFGLAIQYMFWKTMKTVLDTSGLEFLGKGPISIETDREKGDALQEIILFGETQCSEEERIELSMRVGEKLDIDYRAIAETRILSIMNMDEIGELARSGIDIELHTHRHDFRAEHDEAVREIADNRAVLEPVVGKRLEHFCYPGGRWSEEQWAWLTKLGIRSAATCDRGLNSPMTPKLGLKRFGDSEALSQIEFEAELFGFAEMFRMVQSGLRGIGRKRRKSCSI